jgi:hypothetical protein
MSLREIAEKFIGEEITEEQQDDTQDREYDFQQHRRDRDEYDGAYDPEGRGDRSAWGERVE